LSFTNYPICVIFTASTVMDSGRVMEIVRLFEQLVQERFTGFIQFFLKEGGVEKEVVKQERVSLK